MENEEIRNAIEQSGLRMWQVADRLHRSPSWLSVKLRHRLPEAMETAILDVLKGGEN